MAADPKKKEEKKENKEEKVEEKTLTSSESYDRWHAESLVRSQGLAARARLAELGIR